VIVAGEIAVRDGQPAKVEPNELRRQARAGAERLWARVAES
jgi:hypothetical protein